MSSNKVNKKEETKRNIISGSERQTHYTNRRIEPKRQKINLCNCAIKCVNLFTENQLKEIFDRFYSLKTHNEQNLFLNLLVTHSERVTKIRQQFDYHLEVNIIGNEVYFQLVIIFNYVNDMNFLRTLF
jgi:uncharacterized protein YueI